MSTSFFSVGLAKTTTTPNATMKTLDSPILSGSIFTSVWRTSMITGAQGPLHSFNTEQILVVIDGRIDILVDGTSVAMSPGSGLTIAGNTLRQISAVSDCTIPVTGASNLRVSVPGESAP